MPENFQYLPRQIVGIDHTLEVVEFKLLNVRRLGIVGMGGIGKTTLAKALFNNLARNFEYTCFVEDVKNIKNSDLVEDAMLQHMNYKGRRFEWNGDGVRFLRGKRFLLVLDDVDSERDLDLLPSSINIAHQDSRCIATSRDRELLERSLDDVYLVPLLSPHSSKEVFKTYAFGKDQNVPPMEKYADVVLETCEGLPLSLEIVGKYLRRQPESIWVEVVNNLAQATDVSHLNDKLWTKLKLSYDGLSEIEQEIFLDAATIFFNEDLVRAKAAWSIITNGCQHLMWQHLLDLCLVMELESEYHNKRNVRIGMHKQLLELGRRIASTRGEKDIRIWDKKEALRLLTTAYSTEYDVKDIVALKVNYDHSEENISGDEKVLAARPLSIVGSNLCKMERLRYLWFENINIDDAVPLPSTLVYLLLDGVNFTNLLFDPSNYEEMAVLSLVNCRGLRSLPATFGELKSLQVLHISGELGVYFASTSEIV